MGNIDASDRRGKVNFVTRLNSALYDRIARRPEVYLNDINWLSAAYGLEKWSEPKYWYLYKYALNIEAIPELAFQVANIIRTKRRWLLTLTTLFGAASLVTTVWKISR